MSGVERGTRIQWPNPLTYIQGFIRQLSLPGEIFGAAFSSALECTGCRSLGVRTE